MSKVKSTGIVDMTFTMHEMRVGKVSVRPHTVTGTLKRREEGERRSDILHPSRCARPTEDPVETRHGSWKGSKAVRTGELEAVMSPPLRSLCREIGLKYRIFLPSSHGEPYDAIV